MAAGDGSDPGVSGGMKRRGVIIVLISMLFLLALMFRAGMFMHTD